MLYEYSCTVCDINWEKVSSVKDRNNPSLCPSCNTPGKRWLSAVPFHFSKTHPDVKQDMHELVAGVPASNLTEF